MLDNPRLYPILLILVGAGSLTMAFTAQYGFDLEPCILCLYQRVPFAVAIGLGAIGMWRPEWLAGVFALAVLTFATGATIAFYHVGVEQHWWVSACTGDVADRVSGSDLLASLQAKQPKSCDTVDWTFLGISMATWNVVFSGGLAVVSAYVLKTRKWEA